RFLNESPRFTSSSETTTTSGRSWAHASTSPAAVFVLGASNLLPSTRPSVPACAWADSAPRRAARLALRLTFTSKERIDGGKATPPPVQCGARVVPARARPVPFWRHGLERPPDTSPRLLAPRVPARSALSSARTVSWTRCGFTSAPKTSPSSVTCLVDLPAESRRGALGSVFVRAVELRSAALPDLVVLAAGMGPLLPDLDDAVLRPRDRPLDEQQVVLGVDLVHLQADLGDALSAEASGHLDPLENARGRRRGADRAGLADIVRAVGLRPAVEAVPLDRPGEAIADPDPSDLDRVSRLEDLDRDRFAHDRLAGAAELDQMAMPFEPGLLQVAELCLRDLPLGDRLERELHGLVAVGLDRLHLDHRARTGLDHGHSRDHAALLVEELRHAELSADDPFHFPSFISMSTPAGRSSRISESTVFGVGEWMSMSRLCVRTSKCSRESLSLKGLRITQYTFFSVGRGTGPVIVAPERSAVSTMSRADLSTCLWS